MIILSILLLMLLPLVLPAQPLRQQWVVLQLPVASNWICLPILLPSVRYVLHLAPVPLLRWLHTLSKALKKPPVEQHVYVCVLKCSAASDGSSASASHSAPDAFDPARYLLFRRSAGLLAGQLEFPSLIVSEECAHTERVRLMKRFITQQLVGPLKQQQHTAAAAAAAAAAPAIECARAAVLPHSYLQSSQASDAGGHVYHRKQPVQTSVQHPFWRS